jgi:hypothetical protein
LTASYVKGRSRKLGALQCCAQSGLPDGLFSNPKSQFWVNLEGLRLENLNIFYGHLEYFMEIWNIL